MFLTLFGTTLLVALSVKVHYEVGCRIYIHQPLIHAIPIVSFDDPDRALHLPPNGSPSPEEFSAGARNTSHSHAREPSLWLVFSCQTISFRKMELVVFRPLARSIPMPIAIPT